MKSSKHQGIWNASAVARTVGILVLVVLMVGMSVTPVLADGHQKHHKFKRHHGPKHYYAPREYYYYAPRAHYYPAPVYVAPPPAVVYAPPPPPPGISIVFPIHIR